MIVCSHVYKTYPGPVHALKNIDLKIDQGEFVFLTGPSGAGKTTLFKLLCAFDQITSGHLEVCNTDISSLSSTDIAQFRRQIGVVFQDFKLLKNRSFLENVCLPLDVLGIKKSEAVQRAEAALEQVGLKDRMQFTPMMASGGEQQRCAIARAIVHKPGVIIADEPTGNLDPELSAEVMNLFLEFSQAGTTVLVATHDMARVHEIGARRIELRGGLLVSDPKASLSDRLQL